MWQFTQYQRRSVSLKSDWGQVDVKVHNTTVVALVLRRQAGIVEQLEHQVICSQDVCGHVLNSRIAGNLCEPLKRNVSYSGQVIVVGHDDKGCAVAGLPQTTQLATPINVPDSEAPSA
jgi:hypothetical protein